MQYLFMQYLFKTKISVLSDGKIFTGDNAEGYVKGGILFLNNDIYKYEYKNEQWFESNYPCGEGRIPVLQIKNLNVLDFEKWNSILYVPHEDEEN